jgi:Arc/MetJ-type ribon-helix-helix transcriptional regulator
VFAVADEKERKYTTVSIPVQLYEKIKQRIEGTGFTSVSDYVTYVLREVLASLEEEEKEEVFTKEEEEKVKERLRALGYLD